MSAERWRRAITLIVDTAAIFMLLVALMIAAMLAGLQGMEEEDLAWFEGPLGSLAIATLMLCYYVVVEGLTGRTLGKLVTRTRVVNAEGGRLRLSKVLIRALLRFLPFEWVGVFLSERRALHDSWSDTFVVLVQKPAN